MSVVPIWVEALIVASACGVIGGTVLNYGHNRYLAGVAAEHAERMKDRSAAAKAMADAQAIQLANLTQRDAKLLDAQNENAKLRAQIDTLRASTAASIGRLQQRIVAAERAGCADVSEINTLAGFGTPSTPIGAALGDCAEAYRQLALAADADRAAGLQCERHADAQ